MIRFFFACLLLFVSMANAQNARLSGRVLDENRKPFPGATIRLLGTALGAVSNEDGQYEIARIPAGLYQVSISAIGFVSVKETLSFTGSQGVDRDFVLQEENLQTDEVVITATRREQLSSAAPVSISVLGAKEIETRNIVQLDDALRYTPGVQMSDNQVNVRGSTGFAYGVGSRIQFLIDGVPMLNADTGGISFNVVPTAQIQRVEVIKGPGSALYGGGALGGVINVITKDYPDKPSFSVRAYSGFHPPVRYDEWKQTWEGARKNRYFGGGTMSRAKQVSTKFGYWVNLTYLGTQGYLQNSEGNEAYGAAKFGWQITPKLKLETLTTLGWAHKFGFVYWMSARDALRVARTSLLNGSSDNDTRKLAVLPVFTYLINTRAFISFKTRFFGVQNIPIGYGGILEGKEKQTLGARYGSEVQFNLDLKNKRYLIAGASVDRNATESQRFFNTTANDPKSQPESAIFAQYEQSFNKLNAVLGVRFDRYQISATETVSRFSPKVSFSYTLNPLLNVRAAWGYGFRVPGVTERYVNNSEFLPVIPNPSLRPEQSTGYEVGIKGFFPLPLENWGGQYDMAVFLNDYNDLVEPKYQADARAFQFINLTKGKITGLDASLSFGEKSGKILVNAAYTYLNGKDLSDANKPQALLFRAKHLFQTSLSINPWRQLDLSADFRYASKFDRVDADFGVFVPDAGLHIPTKVIDLRAGYTFGNMQAAILVKNAGEYYYMERPAILAPTRNFILQLQANL